MEQRKFGFILILIAGVLVLIALLLKKNGEGTHSSRAPLPSDLSADDKIDQSLRDVDIRQRFIRERTALENESAMPAGEYFGGHSNVHGLQLQQERAGQEILKKLESDPAKRQPTPEERIQRKQERDQWVQDYDVRYEKEFVRQFQENARREGYNVRVNDNLDVTGINPNNAERPIRVPQSLPSGSK